EQTYKAKAITKAAGGNETVGNVGSAIVSYLLSRKTPGAAIEQLRKPVQIADSRLITTVKKTPGKPPTQPPAVSGPLSGKQYHAAAGKYHQQLVAARRGEIDSLLNA